MDDAELTARLQQRGLRVTSQRLIINRVLTEHGGHRSAEQVLELVAPVLPGVSQQTVYNTLQTLADLGAARRVAAPGGSTRFETRLDAHHHMVCSDCGEVRDLDLPLRVDRAITASRAEGFSPDSAMVTVLGRCSKCGPRGSVTFGEPNR